MFSSLLESAVDVAEDIAEATGNQKLADLLDAIGDIVEEANKD